MHEMTSFSIIIPTYNSEKYIANAIESVMNQTYENYELIVVDDCSSDKTVEVVEGIKIKYSCVHLYKTDSNKGPGAARNVGLHNSNGEYIIFLDSDDKMNNDLLANVNRKIEESGEFDICDFDFVKVSESKYADSKKLIHEDYKGIRKEMELLKLPVYEYKREFLRLHTDAPVIYTCYRRDFLRDNNIIFSDGLHEDVEFYFKSYCLARRREVLNCIGCIKTDRNGSIVNTCSTRHIDGFFEGWNAVKNIIKDDETLINDWKIGTVAIGAVKIRDILRIEADDASKMTMYRRIEAYIRSNLTDEERLNCFQTKYYKLVNSLLDMLDNGKCVQEIEKNLRDINSKSWSCWDVQHSLFLGADEIRECCKRFFVNGQKKGDVVLMDTRCDSDCDDLFNEYMRAKKALYMALNKGECEECLGCPYLKYEQWDGDSIKRISFEYHSVCNLRCIYCSDKYYGGITPNYDIVKFVDRLAEEGMLSECESIVWGGGEPTLSTCFTDLLRKTLNANKLAAHNVITNATMYSPELTELMRSGRIQLITSVDAGSRETYTKVRGADKLIDVWDNLKKYASYNTEKIIIKYIVRKENCDYTELVEFADRAYDFGLIKCNFQISCDFNSDILGLDEKLAVVQLYGLLLEKGADVIFFDELLRERFKINTDEFDYIDERMSDVGLQSAILRDRFDNIVIWGSDNQIKSLIENSLYFRDVKPYGLIAGHSAYYGKKYGDLYYSKPDEFVGKDIHIVIAAVQGTRRIYNELLKAGFSQNQLITKLIL